MIVSRIYLKITIHVFVMPAVRKRASSVRYVNHEAPFVRASAAQTLGRLRAAEKLALLTDQLSVENSSMVRSAIAAAMEKIDSPSRTSLDTVNRMVVKEPDSKARYQMARYIGENIDIYPDGISTLKRLASEDYSKQIRRYVSAVLSKVRQQTHSPGQDG